MTNAQAGKISTASAARRRQPTGDHHAVEAKIRATEAAAHAASMGSILPTAASVPQTTAKAMEDNPATTRDMLKP